MKELDETLQPFFDQHFAKLPRKLQEDFARLLDQEDPTLWDWLVIKKEGVSTEFRDIVERIISK
jgi:succinate dehydrogenase flavin-adding protein (antitoxin of CptAB toxin-antitoxin module)